MSSTNWNDLPFKIQSWIQEAAISLGFSHMTPVQASTIPLLSQNKDVVVQAVTGSGKTLAYVIPTLEKICDVLKNGSFKRAHFGALVIVPTRELADQVIQVFESFLEYRPDNIPEIKSQLLVGSIQSVQEDLQFFIDNSPCILVGTPGRVQDFLSSPQVKTNSCEVVILDEADRLLDIGFLNVTVSLLKMLPKQRRTGLFSATLSDAGSEIFKTGMTNPVKITVKSNSLHSSNSLVPTKLSLYSMVLDPHLKLKVLLKLLSEYSYRKIIVYFPTCISVSYFYGIFHNFLKQKGLKPEEVSIFSLHGKLDAKPRMKTLKKFENSISEKSILFTTDVSARGLDIPQVDIVVQVDPPTDPSMFLHRCGRSARANMPGTAITMLNTGREEEYIAFLKVKGMILKSMKPPIISEEDHHWYDETLRLWLCKDRARYDQAIRSYVGYVRYYSKHMASSIFRIRTLDYKDVARMYGLTRLPKMPENKYVENFPEGGYLDHSIDFDTYAYADKKKEAARKHELLTHERKKQRQEKALRKKMQKDKNFSWSDKNSSKETRLERREKLKRRREAVEQKIREEQAHNGDNSSTDDEVDQKDWKREVLETKRRKKSKRNTMLQGSFNDL